MLNVEEGGVEVRDSISASGENSTPRSIGGVSVILGVEEEPSIQVGAVGMEATRTPARSGTGTPAVVVFICSSSFVCCKSSQLFSTVSRTLWAYSFIFSPYNRAASAFTGLLRPGSSSSDWTEIKMVTTSRVGDHLFCRMSNRDIHFRQRLGETSWKGIWPSGACSGMTRRK